MLQWHTANSFKISKLYVICGLQAPTSGDYTLYGVNSSEKDICTVRRRMGAVVETPAERYLSIITERTEYLKMLTEELFRYSVILNFETDEITNVCVNAILEESIAGMYGAFVEKHITPEIDIMEDKSYLRHR